MINRYEVEAISRLWTDQARFERLLTVELALLDALEEQKIVPPGTRAAFSSIQILPRRIEEIEQETKHDVIAFCTSVTEQVDPVHARYFHFGVTSSDVLDTALSLQVKDSLFIVMGAIRELLTVLDQRIEDTRTTLAVGRSHGMSAEPMVFAQKFLSSRVEFERRLRDYEHLIHHEVTGQISGAVGNYTILSPETEALTLKKLGLPIEPVSSQVIPRDHLALITSIGALTASAIERLAIELRHLHHSDIGEVHEGFSAGQKGSSTMPHKKNPVSSENLSGLARVIRSHQEIAQQNILLWHERDISHSSAERLYLPDHFGLLTYSLQRLSSTLRDLVIHTDTIEEKVRTEFKTLSSFILHTLLAQNTAPREVLYRLVQEASFQANDFQSFISSIQEKCVENKLNANLSLLSWDELKKFYVSRFNHVLNRTRSTL